MTDSTTTGWHWKQTRWNNYALSGPDGQVRNFSSYQLLHQWCTHQDINATQV